MSIKDFNDDCLESPLANRYSIRKIIKEPIILRALNPSHGETILDLGCGAGVFTRKIGEKAKVFGLDYSKNNIKSAQFNCKGKQKCFFKEGDVTNVPLKSNFFDKILSTEVIEHIEDDDKMISECSRLLKKRGRLILTTPCINPIFSLDWLRRMVGIHFDQDFGHKRGGYTKKQLYNLFKKYDLEPLYHKYYDQFFGELAWIITCIPRQLRKEDWKSGKDQATLNKSKIFMIYTFLFPFLLWFAKLDRFLKKLKGHHIIVVARKI